MRALAVLMLLCATAAGDDGEERALLELEARIAGSDPSAVIADAQRFRARYPESKYLPAALLAEMRAHEALRQFLAAKVASLELLARAPESVPARAVLAAFEEADDCAEAFDSVLEIWLANRDPARLAPLRRLARAALESRPDMESEADFVLEAWALVRDDEALAARLEKAASNLDNDARAIADLLRLARSDPIEACERLHALPGSCGSWCAAILVATGALDGSDSTAARLARARADLFFRQRMEPAPLLDPAPGSAAHAALAALALASAGRRDEARELAARESVRFPGEAATPMLAEVEKFLAGPAPDVPAFVEKVFRPALEDLLRGAERWDVVVRPGGGRDVEVRIFLDFPQEEWRLSLKSEGKSAAVFHGKGARVRFWVAGEARIFDVPGGFLPAVRIDLAQAESGTRATDFRSEALPWTEIGKVNAALRRNPLLTTPEGITRLLTRSPRVVLVAAEHGDGDACSFTWGWPDRREPTWRTLRAEFSKGRLAALRSGDAELTLHYGGADDIATPDLVWPEVPVMQREDVPAGQILQVVGRLVQRLGVGQPSWK